MAYTNLDRPIVLLDVYLVTESFMQAILVQSAGIVIREILKQLFPWIAVGLGTYEEIEVLTSI